MLLACQQLVVHMNRDTQSPLDVSLLKQVHGLKIQIQVSPKSIVDVHTIWLRRFRCPGRHRFNLQTINTFTDVALPSSSSLRWLSFGWLAERFERPVGSGPTRTEFGFAGIVRGTAVKGTVADDKNS